MINLYFLTILDGFFLSQPLHHVTIFDMRKILLVLLLLTMIAYTSHAALLKGEQTLTVTGTAIVQIEPDTAKVRLGVEVLRKTAQEAQSGNAEIMQKVMTALEKQGVPKEKMQTSGFNLWPEMKYEPNQPAKIAGYRCSNQVNVTVEDLTKISNIIDAGITAGANNVQGIQFLRKNDLEFKKQALNEAVKEASAKAQAISAAAGLKIKGIKNIIEGGAITPPPVQAEFAVKAMGVGDVETPVSPGLTEVRGNVTIIFQTE